MGTTQFTSRAQNISPEPRPVQMPVPGTHWVRESPESPQTLASSLLCRHGGLSPLALAGDLATWPQSSPRPRDLAAGLTIQMFLRPSISV